jgi:hypothetical protein
MEDGTSKAIPLRRSRTARVVPVQARRLTDRVTSAVQAALSTPRQLWLAGLGGGVLAWRGVAGAWRHLVTEGAEAERRFRGASSTGPA